MKMELLFCYCVMNKCFTMLLALPEHYAFVVSGYKMGIVLLYSQLKCSRFPSLLHEIEQHKVLQCTKVWQERG